MPGLTPSSPINASATARGLVSVAAQAFAGAKTFLAAAVFSAGVQLSLLFGTNGSGAADVVIKAGTTLADASVNGAARVFSVRTGIGGTENEVLSVSKSGLFLNGYQNGTISCSGSWVDMGSLPVRSISYFFSTTTYGQTAFHSTGGAFASNNRVNIWSENATGAGDVAVRVGPTQADALINAGCILFEAGTGLVGTFVSSVRVKKGGVLEANYISVPNAGSGYVAWGSCTINGQNVSGNLELKYAGAASPLTLNTSSGIIGQAGTDSTGTPGAVTANKPIGKAAIAIGAASVVITNSLVTAASHVIVTPHARDATCKELVAVPGAGIITVSGTANATAALPFSWEVKGII